MMGHDVKRRARDRFGQYAGNYVTSEIHAGGPDLDRMVEIVDPRPEWRALDIATGGGHTALRFAAHVRQMVATDIGPAMLDAARANIAGRGAGSVVFLAADAEQMPLPDSAFDLVTCRVAAHHFPDAFRFTREAARVLRPGGVLAVHDHLLPEDARAAGYIEAFERLRDPSHHSAFTEYEWRGMLLDSGLAVEHVEKLERAALLVPWAERQGCEPAVVERLRILLAQAPRAVADWIHPRHVLSRDAGFDHVYILITGRKPG